MPDDLVLTFTSAGLGGCLAWAVIHPLNTLAVRMNLAAAGAQRQNFVQVGRQLLRAEGVSGLYHGLSAGMTRQLFYSTSRLGLYDVFKEAAVRRGWTTSGLSAKLLIGALSGAAAAAVSSPAEVTLVRMSNDSALPVGQRRNYTSLADAGSQILRREGAAAFWRGSQPFMLRAAVVGMSQVAIYDQMHALFLQRRLTSPGTQTVAVAAMIAGLVYSVATNPLETAKNRMAFQKPLPDGSLRYRSTVQTLRTIARAEGLPAFWTGFLPYYLRCGGHTVLMFIFVERIRSAVR